MNSAPSKISIGLVVLLVAATVAGIFAIARPEVIHGMTIKAYSRNPWRRIKQLAEWHQGKGEVRRIRISGIAIVAFVVLTVILIVKNQ